MPCLALQQTLCKGQARRTCGVQAVDIKQMHQWRIAAEHAAHVISTLAAPNSCAVYRSAQDTCMHRQTHLIALPLLIHAQPLLPTPGLLCHAASQLIKLHVHQAETTGHWTPCADYFCCPGCVCGDLLSFKLLLSRCYCLSSCTRRGA